MFVETITSPRADWEHWTERLRILTDPPPTLVASIAWDSGEGKETAVNVWESPEAVAAFFMERTRPVIEAEGEPANKPSRHGAPIAMYLRP